MVDFAFSPEVQSFRAEVREFVAREWPEEKRARAARDAEGCYQEERELRRKLGERGWLTVSWPKEYGGLGLSALEQYGFNLGLAFQIVDDILDLIADSEQLGKTAGIDVVQG